MKRSGLTSLDEMTQDSREQSHVSRIESRLTDKKLPQIKAILEETVNTSSVTDMERLIRK